MRPGSPTMVRFRAAYTELLLAADALRAELDPMGGETVRDIREIQILVAHRFRIPLARLLSATRDNHTAAARHVAMSLARELTNHSLTTIGRAFGRDHGTVMHGIEAVERRCEQELAFPPVLNALRSAAESALGAMPDTAALSPAAKVSGIARDKVRPNFDVPRQ